MSVFQTIISCHELYALSSTDSTDSTQLKMSLQSCMGSISLLRKLPNTIQFDLLWSPYVTGQTIIFSSCFFLSSFFSLAYSQRSEIGCLPYFGTWCGLSANSECRSEMRYMQLAANTGRKKSPSRHHRTTLSGHIFTTKTIGKKLVKQQYVLYMS